MKNLIQITFISLFLFALYPAEKIIYEIGKDFKVDIISFDTSEIREYKILNKGNKYIYGEPSLTVNNNYTVGHKGCDKIAPNKHCYLTIKYQPIIEKKEEAILMIEGIQNPLILKLRNY